MEGSKVGIIIVAVLVLLGGGVFLATQSQDDSDDQVTTTSETRESNEQSDQVESAPDIIDLAVATPDLSTLVAAVQAAELVETLQSSGPFTVFAPNNAAFDALPEGTVDTLLLPENIEQLQAVLTYHVVAGNVLSSDLTDGQVIMTVQGGSLTVNVNGGNVTLTDAQGNVSTVVLADVSASNGTVHVIDSVLLQ